MTYYPTEYGRRLDDRREINRRLTKAFFFGVIFTLGMLYILHLALRDLGA